MFKRDRLPAQRQAAQAQWSKIGVSATPVAAAAMHETVTQEPVAIK